jgi:hypothetical protein
VVCVAKGLELVDEERFFAYLSPWEYMVNYRGLCHYAFCITSCTQWMLA